MSRCDDPQCPSAGNGLREATINPDTGEIIMLTERGQSALTVVTAWNPLNNKVRTIYRADTSLDGGSRYSGLSCPRIDHDLICVEAGPTQPARLVKIDLDTGHLTALDDPNSALRAMRFGPVRHLHWTDATGRPSDGVLLLPSTPSSRPLPLVITTYRCRGFLRGGTGWLAPEHILAQEGFAVLCANTNDLGWGAKDSNGVLIPLNAHKIYLDALKAVIDQLSGDGLVDPSRVGITGHSLSSNTIAYAISHTSLFKAAVLGGSYDIDPFSYSLTATTADSWRRLNFSMMGLGAPSDGTDRAWDAVSPSRHAASVTAALLMQPPESEYLLGLDLFSRMQSAGIPSDMFVYPHEGHMVGIEPLHQYWRNVRSVDWLSFWLLGREHRTPDTAAQYDVWERLRAQDKRVTPVAGLTVDPSSRDRHAATQASMSTSVRMRE
jgi:dipeptidyl aminopeptidase/acylaminoacyl peptidase